MISEGSCDTEDWSNDSENSALHQHILKYIQKENTWNLENSFNCNDIW